MFDCSPPPETSEPMPLPCSVRDLWETEIVPRLPAKLDEQAHALKAYQRYREIERASDLLRALLAWVMGGCSFRQLGCWAVLLGVADISEAAWRKRVRRCGDWLQWLLMELLGSRRELSQQEKKSSQPRVILVDGTSLGQTGGNGDDWRVQLAYDLVEGRLIHVQIGDRHQAETLAGLPGQPGDVFVGDRGYGQRDNVVAMHTLQAEVILRFSPNHCRIEQEDGTRLEISQWLAGLEEDVHISEQEGYCVEEAERVKVRVLALPTNCATRLGQSLSVMMRGEKRVEPEMALVSGGSANREGSETGSR